MDNQGKGVVDQLVSGGLELGVLAGEKADLGVDFHFAFPLDR